MSKADLDTLRRDDACMNCLNAVTQVRLTIEKVARSQAWDIPGAVPFPDEVLASLQDVSRSLGRVHAQLTRHARQHVWPVREHVRRAMNKAPGAL